MHKMAEPTTANHRMETDVLKRVWLPLFSSS